MKSWSIKKKLGFLCGSLLALVLIVGGFGLGTSALLTKQLEFSEQVHVPSVRAMSLADMVHDGLRAVVFRAIMLSESNEDKDKADTAEELAEMTKTMHEQFEIMNKLELAPKIKEQISGAQPEVEAYVKAAEELTATALSGHKAQALAKMPEFQAAFKALEAELERLGEEMTEGTKAEQVAAAKNQFWLSVGGLLVMSLGLLFGVILSVWIVKDLMRTLTGAIDQLSDSNHQVASAASQTSSSATTLSEAVTEQASSLQETMASVEEISAMVNQNAESANRVKLAVDANQAASDEGSTSVGAMLHAIDDIKSTNDSILSQMEESNKEFAEIVKIISEIGEKTKVINDIVFQTKLLSFNASVEAARAGEHGKGFAVVAEEVGNLAQMSGNAAKEISDMLSGSIKKVNGIVEQTTTRVDRLVEVGKDKISMGQSTAQKCREALGKIAANAQSVSTMVIEITHASKEQAQGIQEINKAISQLDQVTQQNSGVAQQSSTQAEHLNSEAIVLAGTVAELVKFVRGVGAAHSEQPQHHSKVQSIASARTAKKRNQPAATKAPARTTAAAPVRMKKAAGSDVPSSNDPNFQDF